MRQLASTRSTCAVEGQAVDDGRAESWIGERLRPPAKTFVRSDGDAALLLALGQNLKQQLSAPAVKLHVPEFINAQKIDTAATGDRLRQLLLVGGFDELVDGLGGQHVADAEAVHRGFGAQLDRQAGLAGAGVADQAERLALLDLSAGGDGIDGGQVDVGIGVEVERPQALVTVEGGSLDPSFGPAASPVVTRGHQQFGEKRLLAAGGEDPSLYFTRSVTRRVIAMPIERRTPALLGPPRPRARFICQHLSLTASGESGRRGRRRRARSRSTPCRAGGRWTPEPRWGGPSRSR